MDYKDLTVLLLKIGGAFLVFYGLAWLPGILVGALKEPSSSWIAILGISLPWLSPILMGAFIFLLPATISNKLIDGQKLNNAPQTLRELELLTLRIVGVFFAVRASADLVAELTKVYFTFPILQAQRLPLPSTPWTADSAANVVGSIVELGFALWLMLGASGIVHLFLRLRGRGEDL